MPELASPTITPTLNRTIVIEDTAMFASSTDGDSRRSNAGVELPGIGADIVVQLPGVVLSGISANIVVGFSGVELSGIGADIVVRLAGVGLHGVGILKETMASH